MSGDYILADVGGTNTRVALAQGGEVVRSSTRRFRNADHPGLGEVLASYLAALPDAPAPTGACAAIAGPVHDGSGRLTNIDWTVDHDIIRSATGARTIAVLNDLQAQGYALGRLQPGSESVVRQGDPARPQATRLVIGVGTGFNVAPVFATRGARLIPPAEAGHVSLPVVDAEDARLARYLARTRGFADVEEALSGRGIENVYAWLGEEAGDGATAIGAEILGGATQGDPRAEATVRHLVRLLGTVAGDLALLYLPFGGIYLIGGVARRLASWFGPMEFETAFCAKGRFSDYMRQFPVFVVNDDYAALAGCAAHLAELESTH